jgi:glycosyltransferase involved in cell wall biosynthesis
LRRLSAEHPSEAARLELVLVGRVSAELEELVRAPGVDGLVRLTGPVSRDAALAAQRNADALLLITARSARGEATGKLFEYLGAGRPILALASDNEAMRIVHDTGTGITVPPDDPGRILDALLRLVRDGLEPVQRSAALEPYLYPAPALQVEREVEHAIAQRGRRATA